MTCVGDVGLGRCHKYINIIYIIYIYRPSQHTYKIPILFHPRMQFMRRQGWGLVQHALINNLYPDKNIPEVGAAPGV